MVGEADGDPVAAEALEPELPPVEVGAEEEAAELLAATPLKFSTLEFPHIIVCLQLS